jgi:hypothetical protein
LEWEFWNWIHNPWKYSDLNWISTFLCTGEVTSGYFIVINTTFNKMSSKCAYSRSWWGLLDTTLCDKVCQWLVEGRWFSAGSPVTSTNKTDRHDITEILLNVALNTITLILTLHIQLTASIIFYNSYVNYLSFLFCIRRYYLLIYVDILINQWKLTFIVNHRKVWAVVARRLVWVPDFRFWKNKTVTSVPFLALQSLDLIVT